VLLVEDDAGLRRTAARTLERAGYTVISARDGEEALTMLEEGHVLPDLVVTDIVMPKRSGVSLYEASRRLAGPPRFLFTSGYAGDQRAGGALDPALPFLRKPWTTGELTRMVRRALDAR
jgi:CheY-like chemotaxis protein